ncbi:MAG: PAS domain S-box protein [Bacteroidales bacterium]|nr:PAS domain S-box protein [Bacteroidales bacterium]
MNNVGKKDLFFMGSDFSINAEYLDHFIQSSKTILYVYKIEDGNPYLVWVTSNVEPLLGYSGTAVRMPSWWADHVHPEDKDQLLLTVFKFPDHDEITYEYRFRCKDGSYIRISDSQKAKRDDKKNLVEIYSSWTNITLLKESEKSWFPYEEPFRNVVEHIQEALAIDDKEGNIIVANDRFRELFKLKEKDLSKFRFEHLVATEWRDSFKQRHIRRMKGEIPETCYEIEAYTADNQKLWVDISVIPLFKDNEIIGSQAIIRDITDRKKMEEELCQAKKKAEESDRLKSAFLHNISHEIRTPLNGILGFAELLMYEDSTLKEKDTYISTIRKSGKELLSVLNDIINIAKIHTGQATSSSDEVNVKELLKEVFDAFQEDIEARGLTFSYSYKLSDPNLTINTDKLNVSQVLTCLLDNARKFTHAGSIEVGCSEEGTFLMFYIQDSGIGIEKERFANIFERFQYMDESSDQFYRGAGLGLSISKAYTEFLGGSIWLESEVGKGSTFYFTIPLKLVETPAEEFQEFAPVQSHFGTSTILIAEDEETNFFYLKLILSKYGYHIIHARDGREAVEFCKNNPAIDLVLMDLKMPIMNGYEATGLIHQMRPDLPIIAQTAYTLDESNEKALKQGCVAVISKPLNKDKLIYLVRNYLSGNKS